MLACGGIPDQSGILRKRGTETAPLDGAGLASSFLNLAFHEVALLWFDIWGGSGLDELEESALAIAGDPVVQHWRTNVTVSR